MAIRVNATATPAKAAIIFVHGLGDTGSGWSWFPSVVKQANIVQKCDSINYVFPNAPVIPITANGGARMPGWFDIKQFGAVDQPQIQDTPGFMKSCEVLKSLVKEQIETHGIAPEKILIGGFSQGAAISLATLALLDTKIGGEICLSGFNPVPEAVRKGCNKDGIINLDTPVFQGHGTQDPVIDLLFAQRARDFYQSMGFGSYTYKEYPGVVHTVAEDELIDVMKFIQGILQL
ncbi:uncharacterized protein KQ657_001001 [Scheffersomyces spartinae]|uniref:Acyl-protein thioesterase 1 n=1 Tax=Scheffersomyces spartinae TaxID=45513 RepID=A0A9P7V8M6_9ASCO|nr:uncharacterized protein KQ657_001001 [Scheffersomyces spartinae]KAG7193239.1 hypothetical protein KQ657_001001 [Scheffersomyces spartinae]